MINGNNLFVYGTLLLPKIMEAVTGSSYESIPATLEGYRRLRLKNEVFPGIIADPEAYTKGKLYLGVEARSLRRLDAFEGDLFERRLLSVTAENGERCQAYVYLVPDRNSNQLENEPWSLKIFRQDDYETFMANIG